MSDFALYILTALSLIFVIEGLLYGLFPDVVRRMMAYAMTISETQFRALGLIMAAFGFGMIWLMQSLYSG